MSESSTITSIPQAPGRQDADGSTAAPYDVWSKWGPKYRFRAVGLLGVNVILFCGLAVFAYWLRTGVWFAPSMNGYWYALGQSMDFTSGEVTLRSMLLDPISIQQVPMQIVVLGLLLAAMIAIPITVAILYRFWAAVPFLLLVAFVAMMPWLAITLAGSCILASVRPFRTTIPFVSALVGLVPASLYLVLASSSGATEEITGTLEPIDSLKFIAPWVLAVVAAAAIFAVILSLAKLVNYRPGAVTPLLLVMFAVPIVIFERNVGRDELFYRLIESRQRFYFRDRSTHASVEAAALEEYRSHPVPRPPRRQILEEVSRRWATEITSDINLHQEDLAAKQDALVSAWDRLLNLYPKTRYLSNALYLKASALDTRIDVLEFERSGRQWIRCYSDFPGRESESLWRQLAGSFPDTRTGAVATLRVAQIEARDGYWQPAAERLRVLITRLAEAPDLLSPDRRREGHIFDRAPAESTLPISIEGVLFEARQLHELLVNNDDPRNSDKPISGDRSPGTRTPDGLLDYDPRSPDYVERLKLLKAAYAGCMLEDNIDVAMLKASELTPAERIREYRTLLERYDPKQRPSCDAVPEMMFRLALAYRDARRPEEARAMVERLVAEHSSSLWAHDGVALSGLHLQSASAGAAP